MGKYWKVARHRLYPVGEEESSFTFDFQYLSVAWSLGTTT